ncbi:MAG: hypothetical protein Sylvanvirus4_37 [Sylvanvirus sp.]|uniref:Uncharacterized protein n=1 Tax=Sylvanvirus sp. TaxID=2487774 RepID=A0A3G5AKA4_9VIRU|nr:MAG: hypothetical protein Sylvanvirus4_37 [Sylvanvirus sp.]
MPATYSYPFFVPRGDTHPDSYEVFVAWFKNSILPVITELSLSSSSLRTTITAPLVEQDFIDSAIHTLEQAQWNVKTTLGESSVIFVVGRQVKSL